MKQTIAILAAASLLVVACKKESKYKYSGTIDGYDAKDCKAFIVSINGNSAYRAYILPQGSTIDTNGHFPVKINFNYTNGGGKCAGNQLIEITGMIITY